MRFKKRGLFSGRRADSSHMVYFIIIEGVIFGIFAGLMYGIYLPNLKADTTFQKNFLTRDLALTLDVVYASPGDLFYVYPYSPINFSRYSLTLDSGKVQLGEKGGVKNAITYWFAGTNGDLARLDLPGSNIDTIILNKTREAPLKIIPVETQVQNGN